MTTNSLDHADAWSAVAPAWDAEVSQRDLPTNDAFARLVESLAVQPGERVLELAAGPGGLGATWARLVGPSGSVLLSDFAPAMVEAARRRNAAYDNVDTAVIDASAIDAPDASFDSVACCMGLMFTPDPSAAFGEIHRVLRPGGRFASLTWGGLADNPWMTIVGMAAMTAGLVTGGPPTGPGGIFSLSDPDHLAALASGAGFGDVAVTALEIPFVAESAEAHLQHVTALAGPLALALQAAPADLYTAFERTALDLAAPYVTATGFAVRGLALLTTGRR
jgi:SAM-dependent methyltransferase